eukprot:CAMPEP_0177612054 /NCGR_PEP_ID=MMETSP0419_2-20121207/20952_1 /TAXON_ID=582737 /ORGANISM="Tetraselmis sp., Strain GSL018" /LENGTH=224 /DNA_ID=CAMNT_0019108089 /DNA_START=106 /DNA_END=780 /DNA_ORIENTATION=-
MAAALLPLPVALIETRRAAQGCRDAAAAAAAASAAARGASVGLLRLLQPPEELGQHPDGVDHRAAPLGGDNGLGHVHPREVHEARDPGGARPVRAGEAVDHDVFPALQPLHHKGEEGGRELPHRRVGPVDVPAPVGHVEPEVHEARVRGVVVRHVVRAVHDPLDPVGLQDAQALGCLCVADVYLRPRRRMLPDRIEWVVVAPCVDLVRAEVKLLEELSRLCIEV